MVPVWIWMMMKARSVWFFTSSNPKLTFGGMDGEPKKEMYDLLPKNLFPRTFNVRPFIDFSELRNKLLSEEIVYPMVVKPEVGCAGLLFRKIDNETELASYHEKMPVEYMVQQLVLFPMEVSVFYIRHPNAISGKITGFLHKIPLQVQGNGFDTLEQLVLKHPKASKRIDELYKKHKHNWQVIIQEGKKFMLSHAANHNRGAHFIDLKDQIDDRLLHIFDGISNEISDFYYGRYDILCSSVEDLKKGENFSILEYNGCGAEPNHIYDSGYTLTAAYKEILKHWKSLYEISNYNSSKGVKPWTFMRGMLFMRHTKEHYKKLYEAESKIG